MSAAPTHLEREEKLRLALQENPFVLAPMAGITDTSFRQFMKLQGAGIVVSELVSATGLCHNSKRTQQLASFQEMERPVGIQIFGENVEHMIQAAQWVESQGADFVDINFGCPVPKVVSKGAGSAALKDLLAMEKLLRAIRNEITIPLTIKIRIGWDSKTLNAHEVVRLASDVGVTWVAIHGRTRAQGYSGLADWDYIGEVKAQSRIPIIGNGDLQFAEQALASLEKYKLDGVMIGRGCLKNPLIFKQAFSLWKGQHFADKQFTLWDSYSQLKEILTKNCEERILQIQLKKFAAWYATGHAGAALFRKTLFQMEKTEDVLAAAREFLSHKKSSEQVDTSREEFLMGGHG